MKIQVKSVTKTIFKFKDPVPLDESELTGTYNATEPKMFCMQKNYLMPNPQVMGVEDCLHLYVYRPKVSANVLMSDEII